MLCGERCRVAAPGPGQRNGLEERRVLRLRGTRLREDEGVKRRRRLVVAPVLQQPDRGGVRRTVVGPGGRRARCRARCVRRRGGHRQRGGAPRLACSEASGLLTSQTHVHHSSSTWTRVVEPCSTLTSNVVPADLELSVRQHHEEALAQDLGPHVQTKRAVVEHDVFDALRPRLRPARHAGGTGQAAGEGLRWLRARRSPQSAPPEARRRRSRGPRTAARGGPRTPRRPGRRRQSPQATRRPRGVHATPRQRDPGGRVAQHARSQPAQRERGRALVRQRAGQLAQALVALHLRPAGLAREKVSLEGPRVPGTEAPLAVRINLPVPRAQVSHHFTPPAPALAGARVAHEIAVCAP